VVPVHHPRRLINVAVGLGADRDALLEGVGLTAADFDVPEGRISYAQYAVLERNALRLTNDPALGFRFGLAIDFSHLGMTGIRTMSAPDLGAAYQAYKQYDHSAPGWDVQMRVEGDRGILTFQETIPRGDLIVFATEAILAGFYALTRKALGRAFQPLEVRMMFPRPAHHHVYAEWFGDLLFRFDQPVTEVDFDASLLQEATATGDPATATQADRFLAAQDAQRAPVDGLIGQVRNAIVAAGGRRVGVEQVARALQTSPRSLSRALQQAGTSFQEVSESVLRARAEERIRSGDTKIESIAQELGFTDARSFRRAFKRWTGHNPNEFRKQT